jgi:hypothetical protein
MRLTTSHELLGPGIIIVQTRDYDEPPLGGVPWELHKRPVLWLARIRDRHGRDSAGTLQLGPYQHDRDDLGDLIGALLWERNRDSEKTREVPAWHFAWPTVAEGFEDEAGYTWGERPGAVKLRPIFTIDEDSGLWVPDERMGRLLASLPKLASGDDAWPLPPKGQHGLVVSAVDEARQVELWHRTDPRLVVPLRDGLLEYGEIIADMSGDQIETERRARLSSLVVVGGKVGGWQSAICGVDNPRGDGGYAAFVLRPDGGQSAVVGSLNYATALGAHVRGGPFHAGHQDDRHKIGQDPDGNPVNPLHIWTEALFYRDQERDGPLEFVNTPWIPGAISSFITRPQIRWDPGSLQWRLWDTSPISEPEPPPSVPPYVPPPDRPPIDTPPGEPPPVAPPIDLPPQGPGQGPGPGDPTEPRPGEPMGPSRLPRELSVKSLEVEAVRERDRQGYDGRYGGVPHDPDAVPVSGRPGPIDSPILPPTPPINTAPLGASIVGRAQTRDTGDWVTRTPGAIGRGANPRLAPFVHAIPLRSALQLLPAGVLPDGRDDQSEHAPDRFAVLLYGGEYHGDDLAAAAELAWGAWDTDLGTPVGGPVLRPVGTPGAADLDVLFRASDGSLRTSGIVDLDGALWVTVDGTTRQAIAGVGTERTVGANDGVSTTIRGQICFFRSGAGAIAGRFLSNGDFLLGNTAATDPRLRKPSDNVLEIEADTVRPETSGQALGDPTHRWTTHTAERYRARTVVDDDYTVQAGDDVVIVTDDATITLPDPEIAQDERCVAIRARGGAVTIGVGSGTVNGGASLALADGECASLQAWSAQGDWVRIC